MKFPYELSQDRLSLLSKEDRELYEYEHSPFYSYTAKQEGLQNYYKTKLQRQHYYLNVINEDVEYNDLSDLEKTEMSKKLSDIEALEIFDNVIQMINDETFVNFSDDEFKEVKEFVISLLLSDNENDIQSLNEVGTAPGHDMTYWIPDMGWLGKLAASVLGTGLAGLVGLIMAGYDKAAAKQLEKYMNKLVELTDVGLHKKKSFFSFFGIKLGKTKKFEGDQSQSCFRSIQELVERNMAKNILICGKATGLLSRNGLDDANSGISTNGGLLNSSLPGSFKVNVADKIAPLIIK